MAKLLEVKNLVVQFATSGGIVHAVNGVSYTVNAGESVAVVGESGCGKSVGALSLLCLIPQPPGRIVDGQVWFYGRDLLKASAKEIRGIRGNRIAMIFQDPMTSLNPVLTTGRQITEAIELHLGLSKKESKKRAVELFEMVGISGAEARLNNYPHQFSGGMRQRVMIAMGLSCSPNILIADEPTTALDVTIQAQIVDLVIRLKKEIGMAVIWITHDLGIVAGIAEQVIVMYSGFIVEKAPVVELYANPCHPYTLGLLHSIPRPDIKQEKRLTPIQGLPPDQMKVASGCPFAPRCTYIIDKCREENPGLETVGAEHEAACWVDVASLRMESDNIEGTSQ